MTAILKMVAVQISPNFVFVGHGNVQNICVGWNNGHALQYYIFVLLERMFGKSAVFAAGASLDRDCKLSGKHEGEKSGDRSDKSKQDGTISSNDTNTVYPTLGSCNVVIANDYRGKWKL